MRVLIGCEYSGIIREEFRKKGHDAWSCDLLDTEIPGNHIKANLLDVINDGWDIGIFHPPCKKLAASGQWYWKKYPEEVEAAADFFMKCYNAPIKKVCVENSAGVMTKRFRKPNQVIDPYFFGEQHRKRTCLWLRGLPRLNGLVHVAENKSAFAPDPIYVDKSGKKRYFTDAIMGAGGGDHKRSKSFTSIAAAMAAQWG